MSRHTRAHAASAATASNRRSGIAAQPQEAARPLVEEPRTHGGPVTHTEVNRRPRYFVLAFGFLEARVEHIDFFDTMGGDETVRLFRRHRARRRAA